MSREGPAQAAPKETEPFTFKKFIEIAEECESLGELVERLKEIQPQVARNAQKPPR